MVREKRTLLVLSRYTYLHRPIYDWYISNWLFDQINLIGFTFLHMWRAVLV